jgi:hypothetical protein
MTAPPNAGAGLAQDLWHAPLSDRAAPERAMLESLRVGASYDAVKTGLQRLLQFGLPGDKVSAQAQARWPNSIDMALLAFDLAPPAKKDAALVMLHNCVIRENRRRAALAGAYLRANLPMHAQDVLDGIDPSSATAAEDIRRRAELALESGDLKRAQADIDTLGRPPLSHATDLLQMQLCYRRDGVTALLIWLSNHPDPPAAIWQSAFHIFISEGDFELAPQALAKWQDSPNANPALLSRAQTRLALECGDEPRARGLLEHRLDKYQPWQWTVADHVQWLRCGQLAQHDPARLLDHARAACRVHSRHDWLHHLCRHLHEAVEDWQVLANERATTEDSLERALIAARAALRMGLSGQAAGVLARARYFAATSSQSSRLMSLRAEAFWMAGRISAAITAQQAADDMAVDAAQKAEVSFLGAEIALIEGDPAKATAMLAPTATKFPKRMALPLTQARIAFMQGEFASAVAEHARFNHLKLAQTGTPAPPDVRDRIAEDALAAAQGIEAAFAPALSLAQTVAQAGLERIVSAPGLSACLLHRAHMRGEFPFRPDRSAHIPRQIAHYWQGPHGPAIGRARMQWARLHPGFRQHVFDAETATDWIYQNFGPDMTKRFQSLEQAALRADLFRLCWILRQGGVFTDLDEYPRIPVTPWLDGARAVLVVERGFGTIANNFLAAEPNHPVCAKALDFVCTALDQSDAPYAWWHSGPAQWTRAAFAHLVEDGGMDTRLLSQGQYCRRVATNLPYPHKRSPDHWR